MQHYNEELYGKPKVFDRLKQFVHMRKLFKYWLGFASKRGEFIKSDLHWAFDQWKTYYPKQLDTLTKLNKKQLDARLLKNHKLLDHLSEEVHDKENALDHMNNQREALVETYIKGQRLALALWKNYRKRALHQGFLRWLKQIKTTKNAESLSSL
jgi:hypothetical protein